YISLFATPRLVNSEKAEVDVQSLGARLSLVGLFFGCSLNAPCKQFNGSLCEFYSRFKKASEHKDKLEVVFVSSDQDQKHWQDFLQEMPWPALPFKDRHKKVRERGQAVMEGSPVWRITEDYVAGIACVCSWRPGQRPDYSVGLLQFYMTKKKKKSRVSCNASVCEF
uniref:Thioredoxin-like fold domain-containing protein n=1 Tax=Xiphophorus couchianus TaxID=32473 RepID=A0A3B5LKN8_9TELE